MTRLVMRGLLLLLLGSGVVSAQSFEVVRDVLIGDTGSTVLQCDLDAGRRTVAVQLAEMVGAGLEAVVCAENPSLSPSLFHFHANRIAREHQYPEIAWTADEEPSDASMFFTLIGVLQTDSAMLMLAYIKPEHYDINEATLFFLHHSWP